MNFYNLIRHGLEPVQDLNLDQMAYAQADIAIWSAGILVMLVLLKLMFSRNKFSQIGSGYLFFDSAPGFLYRLINYFLYLITAVGVGLFIIALADPYISSIRTLIVPVEARERIDLFDVSTSKGWGYLNTGRSAGEIGREGFLEFLKMRKGQNDRTALWLFANESYLVEDFIIDDELYIVQAEDAPYVITSKTHNGFPENDPDNRYTDIVAPLDMIELISGEGATKLLKALEDIIEFIEIKGSKNIKRRALLIETDAAVEEYPGEQLKKLKEMNVGIYFLHIMPNKKAELEFNGGNLDLVNAELLKKNVQQYGGKFYDVTDRDSIVKAYEDINRLETAQMDIKYTVNKIFFSHMFILLGILALTMSIFIILATAIFDVYP